MTGDVTLGGIKRLNFVEYSTKDNQTASATVTQAAGTPINAGFTRFSTVASAGNAATAPKAIAGRRFVLFNDTANAMVIFPAPGDNINGQAANASYQIPAGVIVEFYCTTNGKFTADPASPSSISNIGVAYSANNSVAPTTLTAASITGANDVALDLTGTFAGAVSSQLPLASAVLALIPNAAIGQGYNLRILNRGAGAFTDTITTNTGWTLAGTMTIATATFRDFYVLITGAGALTLRDVGAGVA